MATIYNDFDAVVVGTFRNDSYSKTLLAVSFGWPADKAAPWLVYKGSSFRSYIFDLWFQKYTRATKSGYFHANH